MASLAPIPVTVYVVEAHRNFEPVVVGVQTAIDLPESEGWLFDDLEWRLYQRKRWTRLVPHDSPEPRVVTAWDLSLVPVIDGPLTGQALADAWCPAGVTVVVDGPAADDRDPADDVQTC